MPQNRIYTESITTLFSVQGAHRVDLAWAIFRKDHPRANRSDFIRAVVDQACLTTIAKGKFTP